MRRSLIVVVLLVAACSADQEPASTVTAPGTSSTTAPTSTTATTTVTEATTTTVAATTTTIGLDATILAYEPVAGLPFPVQMTARPGEPQAYVITKDGRVWLYDGSAVAEQPVLDISGQVRDSGEQGLLSIALHPEDMTRFYLHYSDNDGDTVVSEFLLT
ncbi:MAG: hypothetical protein ACRDZM_06180, partial [Acidimicrobiia bacterium]